MKKTVKAPKSTSRNFPIEIDAEMLANIKRVALNCGRPWRDVLNEVANQCFRKAWAGLKSVQVQLRAEECERQVMVKFSPDYTARLAWLKEFAGIAPHEFTLSATTVQLDSLVHLSEDGRLSLNDPQLLICVLEGVQSIRKAGAE